MAKIRLSKNNRRYGYIKDVSDKRDYLYKSIAPRRITVPDKVDLREFCSPVEDQGSLGSCTANAIAANLEFLDKKLDGQYVDISRLFVYYNERALEGSVNEDAGAQLRDGIKSLVTLGSCAESLWPYNINDFALKPYTGCYEDALNHRIISYHRLERLADMLLCLAEGYPFVFGIIIYKSFETAKVAKTGIVEMPSLMERWFGGCLGGHAVCAVGYNRITKRFLVRNSWGSNWGQEGYFTIPFSYLEKYGSDFWTIRK